MSLPSEIGWDDTHKEPRTSPWEYMAFLMHWGLMIEDKGSQQDPLYPIRVLPTTNRGLMLTYYDQGGELAAIECQEWGRVIVHTQEKDSPLKSWVAMGERNRNIHERLQIAIKKVWRFAVKQRGRISESSEMRLRALGDGSGGLANV